MHMKTWSAEQQQQQQQKNGIILFDFHYFLIKLKNFTPTKVCELPQNQQKSSTLYSMNKLLANGSICVLSPG